MRVAVIATGSSLTAEQVERVRHLPAIAVSDAYSLAPWASALVSADKAWWQFHNPTFAGRKFSAIPAQGIETEHLEGLPMGTNSGLWGVQVAVEKFGGTEVLLLGFDLGGSHFFGPHPEGLKNTKVERFEVFKKQFSGYKPKGVRIVNCTPGSALTCYPTASLDACLA